MRAPLGVVVLGLAAGLLSGCGGDGGEQQAQASSPAAAAPATTAPATQQRSGGLDGTWKPINDSPIATLTITGTTAETTGQLACPGTIAGVGSPKPLLTLDCAEPDARRKRRTLELDSDGTSLVITWEGPAWGGMIDSLKRVN